MRTPSLRPLCWCCVVLATLTVGCGQHTANKRYKPEQVSFAIESNPYLENKIYPSLVLAISTYSGTDSQTFFTAHVTAPTANAVLRIVVDSTVLNYTTVVQEVLPTYGEAYTIPIVLKWKFDRLYRLRQPGTVDLTFTCYINDEEVDLKNVRVNYRSVNECMLSVKGRNKIYDTRWLFAAYVNEDHPIIDHILSDALEQGQVKRFAGYQTGTAQSVRDQVFAIWYYALNRGIAYSSISCTSNPTKTANVQHIRFFDEVYNTRQANCIDACVFFASILRKIGLKPVIFVEPCHAYLGYYTDKNRRNIELLETTITGWVNFPDLERSLDAEGRLPQAKYATVSRYLTEGQRRQYENGTLSFDSLKLAVARTLFKRASEYDQDSYRSNKSNFTDTTKITYQQLDIEQLRNFVQPIN